MRCKIANNLRKEGKRVVVAAADTFRAVAIDQLAVWCERAGVEMIAQKEAEKVVLAQAAKADSLQMADSVSASKEILKEVM